MKGFPDTDWTSDIDKRCSCNFFKYADGAITWNSRSLHTVPLSSTKVEYVTVSLAVQEQIL